jgi:restriction system protein
MAIPDFQSIMLPLLGLTKDRQEHNNKEEKEKLAQHFSLTDSDTILQRYPANVTIVRK